MSILRPIPRGSHFDPGQLRVGTRVEMEHTTSPHVAARIAKHHLLEDRDYYRKLRQIHLDQARVRLGLMGKVGLAPGTTTMTQSAPRGTPIPEPEFGSPWNPAYPNAAQRYMPEGATIVGGAMAPHDFELAKIYGYTPYMEGWTVGRFGPGPMQEARIRGTYVPGLGQVVSTEQTDQQRLTEEYLKTQKVMRTWTIVGGVVGIGGLIIALLSLGRR